MSSCALMSNFSWLNSWCRSFKHHGAIGVCSNNSRRKWGLRILLSHIDRMIRWNFSWHFLVVSHSPLFHLAPGWNLEHLNSFFLFTFSTPITFILIILWCCRDFIWLFIWRLCTSFLVRCYRGRFLRILVLYWDKLSKVFSLLWRSLIIRMLLEVTGLPHLIFYLSRLRLKLLNLSIYSV